MSFLPSSPSDQQLATVGNLTWQYDAATTRWKLVSFNGATLDTDGTLAANSDSRMASQKATKTYADGLIAAKMFRNVLLNGAMRIFQRDSGALTARSDNTYGPDQWIVLTQTAAINTSQQTDQEDSTPHNLRMTQNQASAQRFGVQQWIEGKNCKHLRGQDVTLSAKVRASNGQKINYAILGWTGTEDTPSTARDVVNDWTSATLTTGNFFNSTSMVVYATGNITPTANTWTDITALTATLGSTFNNLIVMFWTDGTAAQNFTLDVAKVQLEPGSVKTKFERVPYAVEFAACERYFKYWDGVILGIAASSLVTYNYSSQVFGVPMMKAPTCSGGTYTVDAGSAGVVNTSNFTARQAIFTNNSNNWTAGATVTLHTLSISAEI